MQKNRKKEKNEKKKHNKSKEVDYFTGDVLPPIGFSHLFWASSSYLYVFESHLFI